MSHNYSPEIDREDCERVVREVLRNQEVSEGDVVDWLMRQRAEARARDTVCTALSQRRDELCRSYDLKATRVTELEEQLTRERQRNIGLEHQVEELGYELNTVKSALLQVVDPFRGRRT